MTKRKGRTAEMFETLAALHLRALTHAIAIYVYGGVG
jgi:hypothetical protein